MGNKIKSSCDDLLKFIAEEGRDNFEKIFHDNDKVINTSNLIDHIKILSEKIEKYLGAQGAENFKGQKIKHILRTKQATEIVNSNHDRSEEGGDDFYLREIKTKYDKISKNKKLEESAMLLLEDELLLIGKASLRPNQKIARFDNPDSSDMNLNKYKEKLEEKIDLALESVRGELKALGSVKNSFRGREN